MTTATAVRERPILFSGEMVRAILAGRKTQTRRVVKRVVRYNGVSYVSWPEPGWIPEWTPELIASDWRCHYGAPGDRLWVRETWGYDHAAAHAAEERRGPFVYRVDGESVIRTVDGRWRPSIHMPRWASRLTLDVTDVRVERLQDISTADAAAECDVASILRPGHPLHSAAFARGEPGDVNGRLAGAIEAFAALWDSLNAKRGHGWDVNPWVWVVSFTRVSP